MATAADIPLLIVSENSSSERRISPSWTISQLKARLEPVTGVPASCQKLSLRIGSQDAQPIEAPNEDSTVLAAWPLQAYAEIKIVDTRPPGARENYTDTSAVEKYEMSADTYEALPNSVLAWKKSQKLGRFDPNAPEIEQAKIAASFQEVEDRGELTLERAPGIKQSARCRILPSTDHRRGTVAFVGAVPEIPGVGAWVGVALDEPTGKNNGSVNGVEYFKCAANCGVFLRAERVEVGDFPELGLDDELADSDEEF
ncbi:hypothetical protein Q7P37_010463 [Cladosporium fusiforme]